ILVTLLLYDQYSPHHRDLPSFPTRRSSDLRASRPPSPLSGVVEQCFSHIADHGVDGGGCAGWFDHGPSVGVSVTGSVALSTECGPREEVLAAAAHTAGIDSAGATLIRDGSNVLYRLAGNTVTRIGPSGSREVAEREIGVSRWLANVGVPGVHALPDLPQPTMVGDCPVTWWQYLAKSRDGTTAELAALLRALHDAPAPEALGLPYHDPFAGIVGRIDAATHVGEEDRDWLRQQLDRLQEMYRQRHRAGGGGVIHGDAGQGNVVVTTAGQAVLIDFEHVSYGDSEWDLIPVGVDYVDFVR